MVALGFPSYGFPKGLSIEQSTSLLVKTRGCRRDMESDMFHIRARLWAPEHERMSQLAAIQPPGCLDKMIIPVEFLSLPFRQKPVTYDWAVSPKI